MHEPSPSLRYIRYCPEPGCGKPHTVADAHCPQCGFGPAGIRTAHPAQSRACLVCARCTAPLAAAVPVAHCTACGATSEAWRDEGAGERLQPDLGAAHWLQPGGVWVRGTIRARLRGQPPAGQPAAHASVPRRFDAWLTDASIKAEARVDAPPLALKTLERDPIRQAELNPVQVSFEAGGPEDRWELSTRLLDVRVHDWSMLNPTELPAEGARGTLLAHAWIEGTVYGYYETETRSRPPVVRSEPDSTPPERDRDPEARNAIAAMPEIEPNAVTADQPEADTTEQASVPSDPPDADDRAPASISPPSACWVLRLRVHLLAALWFWLICDGAVALGSVALGAVWIAVARHFDRNNEARSTRQGLASLLALGFSAAGLAWILYDPMNQVCEGLRHPGLWLPLLAFLFAAWLRSCWARTLLFLLWCLALSLQCAAHSSSCEPSGSVAGSPADTDPRDRLEALVQHASGKVDTLNQAVSDALRFDATSDAVSDALKSDPESNRIPLETALARPDLLKDCNRRVFLAGSSMFESNSAEVSPWVTQRLAQMRLLRERFPDRVLVVTGHSDKSGDETPEGLMFNLALSEKRAESVARWLVDHVGWPAEQIEVQGVGARFPVIDLLGDIPINRRVEFRLKCTNARP